MRSSSFLLLLLAHASANQEQDETHNQTQQLQLDCKPAQLLDPVKTWSVDCVAQWVKNLGFEELIAPLQKNNIDGNKLADMTLETLKTEYDVQDENERKKIVYSVKDIIRKDEYKGNANNWQQFFMWLLPFLAIYKWLSMKYEKQIAKLTKKYRKWQDARAPPKPVEEVKVSGGQNEWIDGINSDMAKPKTRKTRKIS